MVRILAVILIVHTVESISFKNNVCPTFEDYKSIHNNTNCWYDFSVWAKAPDIIIGRGYPLETHIVTTADGYILTMFRIPSRIYNKGPVFLQPGLYASADVFLARRDSLAFMLADEGYDVWLGSHRGTTYSEDHVNYTVYNQEYWEYSLDEIGLYDVPAQLKLIAEITAYKHRIIYIAHSFGTTAALIYSSWFSKKAKNLVKVLVLLAPAASIAHTKALGIKLLWPFVDSILRTLKRRDLLRTFSQAEPMQAFVKQICLQQPTLMERCVRIVNMLISGPYTQLDPNLAPFIFNHLPAGTSFRVMKQLVDFSSNNFRRFNYGFQNIWKYSSLSPPNYNLDRVKVPVFLVYAVNDWVTTKEDALALFSKLSTRARYSLLEVTEPNFNHYDFLFGKDIKALVNDYVILLLNKLRIYH